MINKIQVDVYLEAPWEYDAEDEDICVLHTLVKWSYRFYTAYQEPSFLTVSFPCHIDQAFELLVKRPSSSSFPSTHSAWAFGGATAIFLKFKKAGIATFVTAALIAFSRMYMFLHFPTDVLAGMIMGIIFGIAAVKICDLVAKRRKKGITEE